MLYSEHMLLEYYDVNSYDVFITFYVIQILCEQNLT